MCVEDAVAKIDDGLLFWKHGRELTRPLIGRELRSAIQKPQVSSQDLTIGRR